MKLTGFSVVLSTLLLVFVISNSIGLVPIADVVSGANDPFGASDDYVPLKWALIVLGGFDYYSAPLDSFGARPPIQKVANWLYSKGVSYDIIPDDNLTSPSDFPVANKFSLQYTNSIIKYQVLVVIPNTHSETSASNANLIYSAVGNGSNIAMFDIAPKLLPSLMGFSSSEVSFVYSPSLPHGLNMTIANPFSDGNLSYAKSQQFLVGSQLAPTFGQTKLQNATGKTVWYNWTYVNGFTWGIGMMNGTYGSGKVWWNSVVLDRYDLLNGATGGGFLGQWYTSYQDPGGTEQAGNNYGFIAHAINFMLDQCTKISYGIQGYHEYKGGVIIRLDQDTTAGIAEPINETALQHGWVYDLDSCTLGYGTWQNPALSTLADGMPAGYTGSPSSTVRYGTTQMIFGPANGAKSWENRTSETFIIYNTTAYGGRWLTVKIDFNNNTDFSDDIAYNVWENITYSGMLGKYYLCYVDNETNPAMYRFGWRVLLSEAIPSSWLTTYQYYGQTYNLTYGLHTYQHEKIGNASFNSVTYMWDEDQKNFVANQTWTESMFAYANNELTKCFGATGAGVEADECIVSQAGNENANTNAINAMGNCSFILFYYMYGEPGFYTPQTGRPAIIAQGAQIHVSDTQFCNLASEMTNTLYSVMCVYEHNTGSYNLSFTFTPYSSSFKPANARDLYHFWDNAKYMLQNTAGISAFENNRLTLDYKANSTLTNYVWRLPRIINGYSFSGLTDNAGLAEIKNIDTNYVYVAFATGANEHVEALYGPARAHALCCGPDGTFKNTYGINETVYISGAGFTASTTYDIYVVNHIAWQDGMDIPPRVSNTSIIVTSDAFGKINATAVWNSPLTVGAYDVIVDVNRNGKYDMDLDILVSELTAFQVVPEFPPYLILPILVITTLAAIVAPRKRRTAVRAREASVPKTEGRRACLYQ